MLIFLLALTLSIIFSSILWYAVLWSFDNDKDGLCVTLSIINVLFGFLIIAGLICVPLYLSSKYTIELINKKYHTEYTAEQYFFAGQTIDKFIKTDENLLDNNNKLNINVTTK
jgi:hypothetical protein